MSRPEPVTAELPGDGLVRRNHPGRRPWWLLAVAVGETLTLAALLVNLVLPTHSSALAAALGPVHGALYVTGLLLTWTARFPRWVKVVAAVPVAGAWIAARHAGRRLRGPATGG